MTVTIVTDRHACESASVARRSLIFGLGGCGRSPAELAANGLGAPFDPSQPSFKAQSRLKTAWFCFCVAERLAISPRLAGPAIKPANAEYSAQSETKSRNFSQAVGFLALLILRHGSTNLACFWYRMDCIDAIGLGFRSNFPFFCEGLQNVSPRNENL